MTKYVVPFVGAIVVLGFVACATGNLTPEEQAFDAGGPSTVDAGDDTGAPIPFSYAVGGTISGLAGTGLVLQNKDGDDMNVNADGAFSFPTSVAMGQPYSVTVKTQPANLSQTCSVANGSGTMGSASVTDVVITCATNTFNVGGVVTGMTGSGLVLLNNGTGELPIAENGPFNFTAPQEDGSKFYVTVKTDPTNPEQTCLVAGGTGTIVGGNVTTVNVNCSKKKYTIGGTISGLSGTGLVLQNNGGDDLPISVNGGFAFVMPLEDLAAYSVSVKTNPTNNWQTCTVTNGSGNVAGGPITGVQINCTANKYKVKANVTGLDGTGLVLQNNGTNNLAITSNGLFEFTNLISSGASYSVTVLTNPTNKSQSCSVTNGSSTMLGADAVANVNCITGNFSIGGTVSGLLSGGGSVVLTNNGGSDLTVGTNGAFTFAGGVASGATYNVQVKTQPNDRDCYITSGGTGTVGGASVTNVNVRCSYTGCRFVNNQLWCKDTATGRGCNAFCTAIGLGNPTITDNAWLLAQDTVPECTALASAFGLGGTVTLESNADYACAEYRVADFACSTKSTCPASHRTAADTTGQQYSVCPCGNSRACGTGFEETASDVATVQCPAGSIIETITFASYGLPTGSCGSYAINNSCNAANSKAVVESNCLGKNSCSVRAANDVFKAGAGAPPNGDPCPNQNKVLQIQASCAQQ